MKGQMTFAPLPEKVHFPTAEEKTQAYWKEIDAFKEALRQSKGKPAYNFYDGPPFATGLPHYGHILAGTIKDAVTRFAHQRGYHVERRFGWDCHGLPVEFEIDKKLGINGRQDVMKMGIGNYNEECRKIVQRYTKEWETIVGRFGRWIDFEHDYKTMDLSFMESCWWVFKELFEKDLVYRAFRVMPYSTACNTPLSNFEVSQNYKEVADPSVVVAFKLKSKPDSHFLVWTTTPWTLPSNVALCVNANLTYLRVKAKADGKEWYVGKDRWAWVCSSIKKDAKKDFEIVEELKGDKLVGLAYEPMFPYFKGKVDEDRAWHVVCDNYVSAEGGTCIVHQAPAFGEDDNRVCLKYGIISKDGKGMICPVDAGGCFTDEVTDFKGQHVKAADKNIKAKLVKEDKMVYNGTEVHNYPHCWRSDTPLIYRAVPSWFIKVEDAREDLIANNNKTNWVPKFVQEKRFHNWLTEARDWCVSRSRYWGTPIPLWVSDDFEEVVCIGSVAELEKHCGRKLTDIHRHFIDDITIPSKQGKGVLRRVDEVFDCWFESGSMPYASKHYPFENKAEFENAFPAQFIAEGLDQTRGWFYTLMVLSTHLFNKPPLYNLIVNGLVLAADGKKMSKRLKNYPDPVDVCNAHGADAVRMYMCNSAVVRAEPLKFTEAGVRDVVKDVFLPWYNSYCFLVQEVNRYEGSGTKFVPDSKRVTASKNFMDKWISASNQALIKFVLAEMEAYRLYTVVPKLLNFLSDLTNWYLRLNRDRMRGSNGPEESLTALCTLYEALLNMSVLLAPVVPFITEMIYQNLVRALPDGHAMKAKSVHFVMIPEPDLSRMDDGIVTAISRMQAVVELGRMCRERRKIGLKMPLKSMTIMNQDEAYMKDLKTLKPYIEEELNVMEIIFKTDTGAASYVATLNFKVLGKKLGKDMKAVLEAGKNLPQEDLKKFEETGEILICGHKIVGDEMSLSKQVKETENPNLEVNGDSDSMVILDFTPDEDLTRVALARDVANRVQKLRKDSKLQQDDPIDMWAEIVKGPKGSGAIARVLSEKKEYIDKLLRRPLWSQALQNGHEMLVKREEYAIETGDGADKLAVILTQRGAYFNAEAMKKLTAGDASAEQACRQYMQTFGLEKLAQICGGKDAVKVNCNGKSYEMKPKEHFVLGPAEAPWLPGFQAKAAASPKASPKSSPKASPKGGKKK
jgi:isoleucyl-tRNA synthetase